MDYTWEIEQAKDDTLEIQIKFKHYRWVSKGDVPCEVRINFIDAKLFKSVKSGKYIKQGSTLKRWLPPQRESGK